ncbi:MAG: NUDIX domain-containing protein [Candidatus Vogelbacteria bacterium]|nr:NUDIX domain-containing protein [Candidatus Vogelbacteria bacterium]
MQEKPSTNQVKEKIIIKTPHIKSRTETFDGYPKRFPVPDDKVSWSVSFPEYKPTDFVLPKVLNNDVTKNPKGWADPDDIELAKKLRVPSVLGKWGANFAADPIVTRTNPQTGEMEMMAILRDNGEWAIPGGMVDKGEDVSATLRREFKEETGVDIDMSDAEEIYKGYVDDPRNTDNVWMETIAKHKHVSPEIVARMKPEAGDDAKAVKWLPLTEENLNKLYASHGEMVRMALAKFKLK